ncbi:hypothetical protein BJ546DRAFT_969854 [Cryomyces antarcticus]
MAPHCSLLLLAAELSRSAATRRPTDRLDLVSTVSPLKPKTNATDARDGGIAPSPASTRWPSPTVLRTLLHLLTLRPTFVECVVIAVVLANTSRSNVASNDSFFELALHCRLHSKGTSYQRDVIFSLQWPLLRYVR